jgi:hypothetical protein
MADLQQVAGDVFEALAQSPESRASLYRAFLKALTEGDQAAMKGFLMMPPIRIALGALSEERQRRLLQEAHADVLGMLSIAIQEWTTRELSGSGRKQIRA